MRIPFEMLSVIVAYISQIEQMFSGDSQINCELVLLKLEMMIGGTVIIICYQKKICL